MDNIHKCITLGMDEIVVVCESVQDKEHAEDIVRKKLPDGRLRILRVTTINEFL